MEAEVNLEGRRNLKCLCDITISFAGLQDTSEKIMKYQGEVKAWQKEWVLTEVNSRDRFGEGCEAGSSGGCARAYTLTTFRRTAHSSNLKQLGQLNYSQSKIAIFIRRGEAEVSAILAWNQPQAKMRHFTEAENTSKDGRNEPQIYAKLVKPAAFGREI
jgi:hypothetical protein